LETNIEIIIQEIESFIPKNDDWLELESILGELFNSHNPELGLDVMLGIYERYPDEDNDILWGMLHGIEDIENYELKVIESVSRKPSFFGVLMLHRILNANISSVGGISLIDTLKEVANNSSATNYVRKKAERFVQLHSKTK
jgi:hypothetical protein